LVARPVGIWSDHHVISRSYLPDLVTDPFDNAGSLMTKDRRERCRQLSGFARNVGVADADCDNPDEHVFVLEIREFDLFDDEWAPQAVNDSGCTLHGLS
jgi:hypothetical protein